MEEKSPVIPPPTMPDAFTEAAREISKICEKYDLRTCNVEMTSRHSFDFHDRVSFHWSHHPHTSIPDHVRLEFKTYENVLINDGLKANPEAA